MHNPTALSLCLALAVLLGGSGRLKAQEDDQTLRVFIFAGQSNMVGSDSKVKDIERFPPFVGLERPQTDVIDLERLEEQ